LLAAALVLSSRGASADSSRAHCEGLDDLACRAVTARYYEGVTDTDAKRALELAGETWILSAMRDPKFSRPDNLVAFLYHRGGSQASSALVDFVSTYDRSVVTPERFRALFMAPMALGMLVSRGHTEGARPFAFR
jgi:hypothetical protein